MTKDRKGTQTHMKKRWAVYAEGRTGKEYIELYQNLDQAQTQRDYLQSEVGDGCKIILRRAEIQL